MIVTDVTKTLGKFRLNIASLALRTSGIYGLIGPNGSGKSTAAKLIAGILSPDSGSIDREGLRPQDITMLTQKPYMMDDTIYNNLVYPLKIRGIKPEQALCEQMLERCGLIGRQKQNARSLSGGEQQKLALCRAMIFRPRMIIADESFADLDIDSVDAFEGMVLEMQRRDPAIWLIISHQIPHIRRLCDYLFVMSPGTSGEPAQAKFQGAIAGEGPVRDILASQNPVIRAFLNHEWGGLSP